MVNKLIQGMIAIVIGLALLPVVASFTSNLVGTELDPGTFYDTTIGTLISILPILYVIILVVGVVGYLNLGKK